MTIGAVGGVYSYTNFSYQYQLFSSAVSSDKLNDLMRQYGVIQTGDELSDLQALYAAMYSNIQTNAASAVNSSNQIEGTDAENVPWADVMKSVGLYPTGTMEDDYYAFTNRIDELEASQSSSDNATLEEIRSEGESLFAQASGQTTNSTPTTQMSGADIIAQLNKAFILG